MPAARPAAPPPVEPAAESAGFQGLRVAPKTGFTVFAPKANSGTLVLPMTMASAASRRSTIAALASGTWSFISGDP
jgi:hypothetical protein